MAQGERVHVDELHAAELHAAELHAAELHAAEVHATELCACSAWNFHSPYACSITRTAFLRCCRARKAVCVARISCSCSGAAPCALAPPSVTEARRSEREPCAPLSSAMGGSPRKEGSARRAVAAARAEGERYGSRRLEIAALEGRHGSASMCVCVCV